MYYINFNISINPAKKIYCAYFLKKSSNLFDTKKIPYSFQYGTDRSLSLFIEVHK